MGILRSARAALLAPVKQFVDSAVTQRLRPFLAEGEHEGERCSDFFINEEYDVSIENMIVRPSVANEVLARMGVPYRVVMIRSKRVFVDIPWGELSSGQWKLEIDGLHVVMQPLEEADVSVEALRKAKASYVEKAFKALVAKLNSLKKPKGLGLIHRIMRHLQNSVNLTGAPRVDAPRHRMLCTAHARMQREHACLHVHAMLAQTHGPARAKGRMHARVWVQ